MKLKPIEQVNYIVVHCSATPPTHDWTVDDVRRSHKLRGYLDVGYHFVIRRDGTVDEGRPLPNRGAHARGFNHESIGVCLIGGTDSDGNAEENYTEEQYQSLRNLLLELQATHTKARILGHRDLPRVAKACPSFDVRAWWSKQTEQIEGEQPCSLS